MSVHMFPPFSIRLLSFFLFCCLDPSPSSALDTVDSLLHSVICLSAGTAVLWVQQSCDRMTDSVKEEPHLGLNCPKLLKAVSSNISHILYNGFRLKNLGII